MMQYFGANGSSHRRGYHAETSQLATIANSMQDMDSANRVRMRTGGEDTVMANKTTEQLFKQQ
jgi:hypothetical protein